MRNKITSKILWHLAWKLGYSVREIETKPLKTLGHDPRELPYHSDLPYTILNLPTNLGVGLRFFSLKSNTVYHPFILALKEVNRQDGDEKIYKLLKKYSELFSLKTPDDNLVYDIDQNLFPKENHPYSFTYPWSPLDPTETMNKRIAYNLKENKRSGLKTEDSLDLFGTSEEKVRIEKDRLLNIFYKVKSSGFKPQYPDSLGGFILKKDDSFRWFVQGGQHRAAVLTALGYNEIPVHVKQIIRREEVAFWPQVISGLFSQEKALLLFDHMFEAKLPMVAKTWCEYIDSEYKEASNSVRENLVLDKNSPY